MSNGNLSDLNFDAQTVEPNQFDNLPPGEYQVAIVDSVRQNTKAGTGQYLQLELQVLDGPHRGRKLFDRLNIVNPSAKAAEIARGTLSAICRAVGVMTPQHSGELHDKPLLIKVTVKDNGEFGPKNEIVAYKPLGGQKAAPLASPATLPPHGAPPPNDEIPF